MKNRLLNFFLIIFTYLIAGCTSILIGATMGGEYHTDKFDEDIIHHIAKEQSKAKKQQNIVIIGDKYLYYINDKNSIKALDIITQQLDPNLQIYNKKVEVRKYTDNSFQMDIKGTYQKKQESFSPKEEESFHSLHMLINSGYEDFKKYPEFYTTLKGKLYKIDEKNKPKINNERISSHQPLQVELFSVWSERKFDPQPLSHAKDALILDSLLLLLVL